MTYFVTGATGFIGRHLVEKLLELREGDVHVLVRESSQDKLAALNAEKWGRSDRIKPVIGDLGEENLGISDADLEALEGNVQHFFHLASVYDMTADEDANRRANVEGTRHAVELANALEAGCFHHVSSIAAAGLYKGLFREDMFDEGQKLEHPYHKTKFESEKIARTQTKGPWRVYRPAVVVGHSETGEMDKVDGPYYLFPAINRLAGLPDVLPLVGPDLGDTNIVPVDYVAKALLELVVKPGLDGHAFHLVNPEPQPVVSVYNAFAKAAGAPTITVQLGEGISKRIIGLVKLTEHIPGVTIARDAVMERFGIPPVLLDTMAFPSVFSSAETRKALAGTVEVPRLEEY